MKENEIRIHRVGAITTGIAMIVFGILFLLHMFWGLVSYGMIFRLWPFILVGLGAEVFLSSFSDRKFVYDKAAIFLLILVTLFVMLMAAADMCFTYMGSELFG